MDTTQTVSIQEEVPFVFQVVIWLKPERVQEPFAITFYAVPVWNASSGLTEGVPAAAGRP